MWGWLLGCQAIGELKSWTGPWRPLCPLQPLSRRRETQGHTATREQSHRKWQQRRDQNLGLPSPHSQNPARSTKEVRAAEFEKGQEGETRHQPTASSPRCNVNEQGNRASSDGAPLLLLAASGVNMGSREANSTELFLKDTLNLAPWYQANRTLL